jgi:hypothetical protein
MYRAGCNFFWLHLLRSMTPSVPLSLHRVLELTEHLYSTPRPFKGLVVVHGSADPSSPRTSGLLMLSPEELCHAYLFAIDQAITSGKNDDTLLLWKKHCLSVCFEFVDVGGADGLFWCAWNQRDGLCQQNHAIERTARQKMTEIWEVKLNLAKQNLPCTAVAIVQEYTKYSKAKDTNPTFVQGCLMAFEKICRHVELTSVIERLELSYGLKSCLNSITKLVTIAQKCDTPSQRILVITAIEDAILRGVHSNSKFTREFLFGNNNHFHVSFLHLVTFKWRVRTHLLTVEMPREKLNSADISRIEAATADYVTYRKLVESDSSSDTTWIGTLQPSSVLALRVLQVSIVFVFECWFRLLTVT